MHTRGMVMISGSSDGSDGSDGGSDGSSEDRYG